MTWTDFWNAVAERDVLMPVGLSLLIIGATFRWFGPLSRWRGLSLEALQNAWWIKAPPGEGIPDGTVSAEEAARRANERVQDHIRLLAGYGQAVMGAGVVLLLLGALWL